MIGEHHAGREQVGRDPEGEGEVREGLPVDGARRDAVHRQHGDAADDPADERRSAATRRRRRARSRPPPKPIARSTAISRERSETAEYMVLSAPKTAPRPITMATSVPSTVISLVTTRDCVGVVLALTQDLELHARVALEQRLQERREVLGRAQPHGGGLEDVGRPLVEAVRASSPSAQTSESKAVPLPSKTPTIVQAPGADAHGRAEVEADVGLLRPAPDDGLGQPRRQEAALDHLHVGAAPGAHAARRRGSGRSRRRRRRPAAADARSRRPRG